MTVQTLLGIYNEISLEQLLNQKTAKSVNISLRDVQNCAAIPEDNRTIYDMLTAIGGAMESNGTQWAKEFQAFKVIDYVRAVEYVTQEQPEPPVGIEQTKVFVQLAEAWEDADEEQANQYAAIMTALQALVFVVLKKAPSLEPEREKAIQEHCYGGENEAQKNKKPVSPDFDKYARMQEQAEISAQKQKFERTKKSVGLWHYIRVFCCFFPLITTVACGVLAAEMFPGSEQLLLIMLATGVVSALIVAPGKYFGFGAKIIGACAVFGFTIFIFPFSLLTAVLGVGIGLIATVIALGIVPAIFTIYTYITDIRHDRDNNKKEFIAIASGVIAVIICSLIFCGIASASGAANAGELDESFDVVSIYQNYIGDYELAEDYSAEILEAPVSCEKSKNGYVRTNTYDFTKTENGLRYHYEMEIQFKYIRSGSVREWIVQDVRGTKTYDGHDTISGTYTGNGEYPGNALSLSCPYSCTITLTADGGGNGTLDVDGNHLEFTIKEGDFIYSERDYTGNYTGNGINLIFDLEEPLVISGFFGEGTTYEELNCVFNIDKNTITIIDLNDKLELTLQN